MNKVIKNLTMISYKFTFFNSFFFFHLNARNEKKNSSIENIID